MNNQTYEMLHDSADRLALEAVRRMVTSHDEAARYKTIYERALSFLIEQYKNLNVEP